MTVVVNPHSEQEEKVLLAFLDSLQYDYQKSLVKNDILTEEQKREILRRDEEYMSGKVEARDWKDVIRDLESVYR